MPPELIFIQNLCYSTVRTKGIKYFNNHVLSMLGFYVSLITQSNILPCSLLLHTGLKLTPAASTPALGNFPTRCCFYQKRIRLSNFSCSSCFFLPVLSKILGNSKQKNFLKSNRKAVNCSHKKKIFQVYSFSEQVAVKGNSAGAA